MTLKMGTYRRFREDTHPEILCWAMGDIHDHPWDELYRPQLATLHGCEKNDVASRKFAESEDDLPGLRALPREGDLKVGKEQAAQVVCARRADDSHFSQLRAAVPRASDESASPPLAYTDRKAEPRPSGGRSSDRLRQPVQELPLQPVGDPMRRSRKLSQWIAARKEV